jgi:farnesyl-diphosphate farnesyltransferase
MEEESRFEKELGDKLLASVSRSFYLTLKALPAELRETISLAYLLARTADTLADTDDVPAEPRLRSLTHFHGLVQGERQDVETLSQELTTDFLPHQTDPAEATLLQNLSTGLAWLATMQGERLLAIRGVLQPIIRGQMLDIQRFPVDGTLRSLQTEAELEDYTYLVAGCVGEFWTQLCQTRLEGAFPEDISAAEVQRLGINYGKGLQLLNILRDLGKDARMGRCYLPAEDWAALGCTTAQIQANPLLLKPVWDKWLFRCQAYLTDGTTYLGLLQHSKVRYASALPVLIGWKTIKQLKSANPESLISGVKISRTDIASVLLQATLSNTPTGLQKLAQKFQR